MRKTNICQTRLNFLHLTSMQGSYKHFTSNNKLIEALKSHDLYAYSGHGDGKQLGHVWLCFKVTPVNVSEKAKYVSKKNCYFEYQVSQISNLNEA